MVPPSRKPRRGFIRPRPITHRLFLLLLPLAFLPWAPAQMELDVSSDSAAGLVANLKSAKILRTRHAASAMRAADRQHYVDFRVKKAYEDTGQSIGAASADNRTDAGERLPGRVASPRVHAFTLRQVAAHLTNGSARVLDIGCGAGLSTAYLGLTLAEGTRDLHHMNDTAFEEIFHMSKARFSRRPPVVKDRALRSARLAGHNLWPGFVVGVDRDRRVLRRARRNIEVDAPWLLSSRLILLRHGDGLLGVEDMAPFSVIVVGVAVPYVPDALTRQLAPGGIMVVAVGNAEVQRLMLVKKDRDGSVHRQHLQAVRFPVANSDHLESPTVASRQLQAAAAAAAAEEDGKGGRGVEAADEEERQDDGEKAEETEEGRRRDEEGKRTSDKAQDGNTDDSETALSDAAESRKRAEVKEEEEEERARRQREKEEEEEGRARRQQAEAEERARRQRETEERARRQAEEDKRARRQPVEEEERARRQQTEAASLEPKMTEAQRTLQAAAAAIAASRSSAASHDAL